MHRPAKTKKRFVLVHGAWSHASAWQAATPLLKAQGREVIEVNLPGHGSDTTSFAAIFMDIYVQTVKASIGDRKRVILVGHNMAGLVISQVAESIPSQIKELIYLAAYLPADGESLLSLAKQDGESHVAKYLQIDRAHGSASIVKGGVIDVFAADAPAQTGEYIAEHIQPEPLAPAGYPGTPDSRKFRKGSKSIHLHNTGSYHRTEATTGDGRKSKSDRTYWLESSHTPFISTPGKLADILNEESK
jgi:pimeloyl-ACP methyl ester carboxylesterase